MKYAIIVLCSLILIFPLYLMFIGSFQNIVGLMKMPPNMYPVNPTWKNYTNLLTGIPLIRWLLNTLIISFSTVCLAVITTFMAGYAMTRIQGRLRHLMYMIFLIPIMIPRQTLLLPLYVTVKRLQIPSMAATVLPAVFYPVGIFLCMNYIRSIPSELIDAAKIDGAGNLKIIFKVVVPLSKPILACIAIFSFIGILGDYVWQYLLLRSEEQRTLLIGLIGAVLKEGKHFTQLNPIGLQLTAGVILFMPLLIVFISFQKYFQSGLTLGGIR